MRFIVTTNPGLSGARLSRPDHWGNMPHDSAVAAEAAARLIAGRDPCQIEHERGKPPRVVAIAG